MEMGRAQRRGTRAGPGRFSDARPVASSPKLATERCDRTGCFAGNLTVSECLGRCNLGLARLEPLRHVKYGHWTIWAPANGFARSSTPGDGRLAHGSGRNARLDRLAAAGRIQQCRHADLGTIR